MSTFNGEKYIIDQINSIFAQKDVDVALYIRDDGSTDKTVESIQKLKDRRIVLNVEKNVGYIKSFMQLVATAPDGYDFYAFSDQDDVWKPDKLSNAVEVLSRKATPFLYCAAPEYVDAQLRPSQAYHSVLDDIPEGLVSAKYALSLGLLGLGCTMVWNPALQKILKKADYSSFSFGHDNLLSVTAAMVGDVFRDGRKVILYRQHNANASSSQSKQKKQSLHQILAAKYRNMTNMNDYYLRKFVYDNFQDNMCDEKKTLLEKTVTYRGSILRRVKLIRENLCAERSFSVKVKHGIMVLIGKY